MQEIVLDFPKLGRYEKKRKQGVKPQIVMGIDQKIRLQRHVIYWWKIEEELEGICTLNFNFKSAKKWNGMSGEYSCYQIQRNAEGIAVLVRIPE